MSNDFVDLGPSLNHLLNRDVSPEHNEIEGAGLELPQPGYRAKKMAVVAISGRPGSGKSTLALQIATCAAQQGIDSLYLSLEDHPEAINEKAKSFRTEDIGWDDFVYLPKEQCIPAIEHFGNPLEQVVKSARAEINGKEPIQKWAREKFRHKTSAKNFGAVIVASLLPRPVDVSAERATEFFLQQYEYLETLVKYAAAQSSDKDNKEKIGIRMIIIDSLSMLTYAGQSRESIYRIFDLFRAHGIMGILTVDGDAPVPFDSTMADVVFTFSKKSDTSYLVHYLSVEKSRYTPTSFGLHPYKISKDKGIYVFLSLHAVVAATQSSRNPRRGSFPFGWREELTKYVVRPSLKRPGVVALHGPFGTRKTTIAANFLLHGIIGVKKKKTISRGFNESGILIRLRDAGEDTDFSKIQVYPETINREHQAKLRSVRLRTVKTEPAKSLTASLKSFERRKARIEIWRNPKLPEEKAPVLVIIDFNTGMLLPEEFVDIVRGVFNTLARFRKKVRRMVLDDVSVIGGGSYPLLEKSETTADLFLSAFVHLIRNKGVDLMLVGTRSQLATSNRLVDQAIGLADAVVETKVRDVFGDRFILLSGDGNMAEESTLQEWVPLALRINKDSGTMDFDETLLRGLTGFDGSVITRSKVFAYLFEENRELHGRYNRSLPYLVEPLCGLPEGKGGSGLQIISFDPDISDVIHGSVTLAHPNGLPPPKEHTLLATVDEFESRFNAEKPKAYTNNVMLVAWRNDLFPTMPRLDSWQKLWDFLKRQALSNSVKSKVWIDRSARETLSCCLLDCMLSGLTQVNKTTKNNLQEDWARILKYLDSGQYIGLFGKEAMAMHLVMNEAKTSPAWETHSHSLVEHDDGFDNAQVDARPWSNGLPDDAGLYICWYSQLRHLIARRHDLAGQFRIAALPGRGFKGDWKLLVLPGSVSQGLGKAVVDALTTPEEDYRRFAMGVGLPVSNGNPERNWRKSKFRAWPGADGNVTIQTVYDIHQNARCRSDITNYSRITRVLSTFAKRLAGDWEASVMTRSTITGHLRRLPDHVRTLQSQSHSIQKSAKVGS